MSLHNAELAAWVAGALASAMAVADKKHAVTWLGVAGCLCNIALVVSHA
jgi:hypothetical protein